MTFSRTDYDDRTPIAPDPQLTQLDRAQISCLLSLLEETEIVDRPQHTCIQCLHMVKRANCYSGVCAVDVDRVFPHDPACQSFTPWGTDGGAA